MFQLYLLFNKIRSEPLEEIFDLLPTTSPRNWPLISVLVSILARAISFTVNYRENKENSMGFGATLVYFVYIIMAVVARITCFEIFAFSLVKDHLLWNIWSLEYKQNLCVNLRALLLAEILEQPIRMLKNEHSIILRWNYLFTYGRSVLKIPHSLDHYV